MVIPITCLLSMRCNFEEFRPPSLTPFVFYQIMVSSGLILDRVFSFALTLFV
jgi:hypothetical protein